MSKATAKDRNNLQAAFMETNNANAPLLNEKGVQLVLDISDVKENLTGYKKIARPGEKSHKMQVPGLNVYSNNYQAVFDVFSAFDAMQPGWGAYATAFYQQFGSLQKPVKNAKGTAKAVKAPKSPSASRLMKQQLAAQFEPNLSRHEFTSERVAEIGKILSPKPKASSSQKPMSPGSRMPQFGMSPSGRQRTGNTPAASPRMSPQLSPSGRQRTGNTPAASPRMSQQLSPSGRQRTGNTPQLM